MHDHPLSVPSSRYASWGAPTWFDRQALAAIQRSVNDAPVEYVLWDGSVLSPPSGAPIATITFKNRRALYSWVWNPDLNFGETYMSGAVEIRGDLVALFEAIYRANPVGRRRPFWLRARSPFE